MFDKVMEIIAEINNKLGMFASILKNDILFSKA